MIILFFENTILNFIDPLSSWRVQTFIFDFELTNIDPKGKIYLIFFNNIEIKAEIIIFKIENIEF